MEQPITYKYNKWYLFLLMLGAFIALVGIGLIINNILSHPNWRFANLIAIAALLCISIFFAGNALLLRTLSFYNNYVVVTNARGEVVDTIYYKEISAIKQRTVEGKGNSKSYYLHIHYKGKKLKINDTLYNEYESIKGLFIEKTNLPLVHIGSALVWARYLVYLGIVLALIAGTRVATHKDFTKDDAIEIAFIQQFHPSILETTGKRPHKYIEFRPYEYPSFDFKIDGSPFDIMDSDLYVESVLPGDTMQMYISKEDYYSKLKKTQEPGFWTKHSGGYNQIEVLAIRKGGQEFLSIEDYVRENRINNSNNTVGIGIAGAIAIAIALLLYASKSGRD